MRYIEAKQLIDEAQRLKYRGTAFEIQLIARLKKSASDVLCPSDRASVVEFYRRATGGGAHTRVQRENRYKPEDQ